MARKNKRMPTNDEREKLQKENEWSKKDESKENPERKRSLNKKRKRRIIPKGQGGVSRP